MKATLAAAPGGGQPRHVHPGDPPGAPAVPGGPTPLTTVSPSAAAMPAPAPRSTPLLALAVALVLALAPGHAAAQLASTARTPTASVVDLALLLRQLDGEKRVLMIAAHPDDEDTALLATLARGMGARTAYLSLSRGEGGQNLIGPELGEGLGLIRTGELLSARSLDGAEQFFARAFDFGFSRTAEETFGHWPEDELLADVVRVIRRFRPHVIVSVFHGTPRDGHGHHQASGIVAMRAFDLSGDAMHVDGLEPWAPVKLYRSLRSPGPWGPGDPEPEAWIAVETGTLDPLLGRSHAQVAMASRSRHRSQDMGTAEPPGARETRLELVAHRGFGSEDPRAPLFAGVDTALGVLAERAGGGMALARSLQAYRQELDRARSLLHPERPGATLPALAEAGRALAESVDLARRTGSGELVGVLERREHLLSEAILAAGGIVVEARLSRPRAAPGEEIDAEVLVWNGGSVPVTVREVAPALPEGWNALPAAANGEGGDPRAVAPGAVARWSFRVRLPADARISAPYFLEDLRDGSLYRWPDADRDHWGDPYTPPPIRARVVLAPPGAEGREPGAPNAAPTLRMTRTGEHVFVDKALGELREPFHVVPALSVEASPGSLAWPAGRGEPRMITVRVRNLSASERAGEVTVEAPEGWRIRPAMQPFALPAGEEGSFAFELAADEGAADGIHRLRAFVRSEGARFDRAVRFVDYPHIDPVLLATPAEVLVSRFPVVVREGLRVGYVVGPGTSGLDALLDLGVEVEAIREGELGGAELSRYDAVVVGERAYETRGDLAGASGRLVAFARGGGTVVVLYQKYEYPEGRFAPYGVEMARPHDRITDPDAPVALLDPEHPALRGPNRIGEGDFEGWVQERGLYFLSAWEAPFRPLLRMQDPGLDAVEGGLVVAPVGEGVYVYTGLALFRQFPRGVPGAFRLIANLVSLAGADLR